MIARLLDSTISDIAKPLLLYDSEESLSVSRMNVMEISLVLYHTLVDMTMYLFTIPNKPNEDNVVTDQVRALSFIYYFSRAMTPSMIKQLKGCFDNYFHPIGMGAASPSSLMSWARSNRKVTPQLRYAIVSVNLKPYFMNKSLTVTLVSIRRE